MLPLIYDWRAPVSGLFTIMIKDRVHYKAPAGLIEGEIAAKWQYKVKNGKMVYAFESDTKIDDEILKQELGNNGGRSAEKYCTYHPKGTEPDHPKHKR